MSTAVHARILYWGIEGAGKRTNLQQIHGKLRPDHRGDLIATPTRIDPSVSYDELPIELGDLGGMQVHMQLLTVPAGAEQAPTRQQLLDRVDGIVFVVDTRREQLDANLASLAELRELLGAYGRSLDEVPLVLQYNKRDLSDEHALEEMHRKVDLPKVAAFEAVATEGTGVLQTLTTISKGVVRSIREHGSPPEAPVQPAPALLEPDVPQPDPVPTEGLAPELLVPEGEGPRDDAQETAALAEAAFEDSFRDMTQAPTLLEDDVVDAAVALEQLESPGAEPSLVIVRAGSAEVLDERSVALALVLRDETGTEREVRLTLSLDALPGAGD